MPIMKPPIRRLKRLHQGFRLSRQLCCLLDLVSRRSGKTKTRLVEEAQGSKLALRIT